MIDTRRQRGEDENVKRRKREIKFRNRVKVAGGALWRGSVWKERFKSIQGLMYSMPTLFTEHVAGLMISRLLATIE